MTDHRLGRQGERVMEIKTKLNYNCEVDVDFSGQIRVTLSKSDIYNWLQNCEDVEALRFISSAARNRAFDIENPQEYDDFRSRA